MSGKHMRIWLVLAALTITAVVVIHDGRDESMARAMAPTWQWAGK